MKLLTEIKSGKQVKVHDVDAIELMATGCYQLSEGQTMPQKVMDVVNAKIAESVMSTNTEKRSRKSTE